MSSALEAEIEALKAKYNQTVSESSKTTSDKSKSPSPRENLSTSRAKRENVQRREQLRKKREEERQKMMERARQLRAQREARLKTKAIPSGVKQTARTRTKEITPASTKVVAEHEATSTPKTSSPSPSSSSTQNTIISSTISTTNTSLPPPSELGTPPVEPPSDVDIKKQRRISWLGAARERAIVNQVSPKRMAPKPQTQPTKEPTTNGKNVSSSSSSSSFVSSTSSTTSPKESDADIKRRKAKLNALEKLKADLARKRAAVAKQRAERDRANKELDAVIAANMSTPTKPDQVLVTKRRVSNREQKKIGKIQSLGDLQAAIAATDEKNKTRRRERKKKKSEVVTMIVTKEERRLDRESRRLVRESRKLEQENAQIKINNQLTLLLQSMVSLEQAFQKQEQEKIELNHKFGILEAERNMYKKKCDTIHNVLRMTMTELDQLKEMMDRLGKRYPFDKHKGKGLSFWEDLQEQSVAVTHTRHKLHVQLLKHDKAIQQVTERHKRDVKRRTIELRKGVESPIQKASGVNIADLLAQIRQGAALKTVDSSETQKGAIPGAWRASVQLLQSLQDTVKDAMDQRNAAIVGYDSDSSSSDEDVEEWDDF